MQHNTFTALLFFNHMPLTTAVDTLAASVMHISISEK